MTSICSEGLRQTRAFCWVLQRNDPTRECHIHGSPTETPEPPTSMTKPPTQTREYRADHPIYPGGPPCNLHCDGDWSQYHGEYSDGYDRATNEARAALLDELEAAVTDEELRRILVVLPPPSDFAGYRDAVRSGVLSLIQQLRET